ncbi:hypothetical protein [Campylobacter coli]|uniref:hypothetical protein n=1 Tax=Campylobacter coli TaxID=195 RepID=UPI001D7FF5D4|nr:hypothetical protein [Campylobacter coli]
MLKTLLEIILFIFNREIITNPYFLPSILPIYFMGLIVFNKAYRNNYLEPIFLMYILLNTAFITILCSFIVQYFMTEMSFLYLWIFFMFIVIISYNLIFSLLPEICFIALITAIILMLLFSFLGKAAETF